MKPKEKYQRKKLPAFFSARYSFDFSDNSLVSIHVITRDDVGALAAK
jgi:hypothetical protein